MEKEIIKIENIRRDFTVGSETVHALRGVSFSIRAGEFVTIMGTSGSGKSTMLNILGCLDTPTSGEYYLDGISVRTMGKNDRATLRNRKIGFVFQSYNLLPKTTALENVELPLLYNRGFSARQRKEKAEQALVAVGLAERMSHRSNQMSGGQQQRVAIARAVAARPPIILADEPTGNLDSHSGRDVMKILHQLNDEGRTVILITHDNGIAEQAKRVIRIQDGKVVEDYRNEHPKQP